VSQGIGLAERVTVIRHGDSSYQATARNGPWVAVGEFKDSWDLAINSACDKLDSEMTMVRKSSVMFADIFG
jgi:hypothetical protein